MKIEFVYFCIFIVIYPLFFFAFLLFFIDKREKPRFTKTFFCFYRFFYFYIFSAFLFCGCLFAFYPDEIEVDAYFFFFCTIFLPVSSCEVFFLTATFVCRLGLRRKRGAKKYMAEVGESGRGVFLWVCLLRKNAGETGRGEKKEYACVYIKPPKKYAGKCIHFFNIACPLGRLFVCACMCVHFKYPAGSSRQKKSGQHSVCTSLSYTSALDMHFYRRAGKPRPARVWYTRAQLAVSYINTQPCIYTSNNKIHT